MTSLVAFAASAITLAVTGSPQMAQLAFMATSAIMGAASQPDGPGPGDLSAPSLQLGAELPRVYGRVRVPMSPVWISEYHATANPTGGDSCMGGPPEGSAGYTYTVDVLGVLADGDNVLGVTRVWVNKKLVYTALNESTDDSLAASTTTDVWSAIEFFPGTAAQVPWGVYETAVTTANAVAYRNQATLGITGLVCGGSKTPPVVEVEIITAGTQGGALTLLQSSFDPDSTDISVYENGTGTITGTPTTTGGALIVNDTADTTDQKVVWTVPDMSPDATDLPMTFEMFVEYSALRNFQNVFARLEFGGTIHQFGFYNSGGEIEYSTNVLFGTEGRGASSGMTHVALVIGGTYDFAAYVGGVAIFQYGAGGPPGLDGAATVTMGYLHNSSGSGQTAFTIPEFRLRREEVYTGAFTPPTELPAPDTEPWTTATVDLSDIVDAELALNPGINSADWDTSDLVGTTVRGFKAIGPPARTIAELGDIFYYDLVPANPMRFVLRGNAVIGTIAYEDTGAGVDGPGKPFTGLKRGNDGELPAVRGLQYPNVLADHEVGFERGDRLTTDGPDISRMQTNVVLEPSEAKGRAITATLLARSMAHTSDIALTDKYAVLEPGDAYTVTASDGATYNLMCPSFTYADGVKAGRWFLNDTSALVETGITSEDYTPSIIVQAPGETTLLLLDIPILRDADNDPGYYIAVSGTGNWTGAGVYESLATEYEQIATVTSSATTGETTTVLGDWPQPWMIDNKSSVTVSINSTLASYSFDDTIAGTAVPYLIGDEIVYAMTATLVSTGIYTLTGFIRGLQGTEWATGTHAVGDVFVVLQTTGMRRGEREAGELGVAYNYKGVTIPRPLSSATAQVFTDNGVGLMPYAPVDLKKETTDGATVVTWNRRTRLSSTFLGTTAPVLGESSESYDVELYDALDVLMSSDTVTTNEWSASGAAAFENFLVPVLDIRTISSEQLGLREDAAANYTFVRQTIAGGLLGESPNLGSAVYQTTNDGSELYAVTADITTFTPSSYINAKAVRFTRTSLGSAAATYTAATPGDLHGIAYDGTDIWVTEFYGGNLRKLNKTTLASAATYAVSTGMRSLLHDSGSLWITRDYSDEVIQWNIGATTETQRFSVVTGPCQLLIVGSLLFVRGSHAVAAYTAATGALVASVAAPKYGLGMYVVGSYIAAVSAYGIVLIDSTTGLEVTRFETSITYGGTAYSYIRGVAGVVGDTIYVTLGGPGISNQTIGFDLEAAELTGYTVKVYQNSATVGRGYVAELAL